MAINATLHWKMLGQPLPQYLQPHNLQPHNLQLLPQTLTPSPQHQAPMKYATFAAKTWTQGLSMVKMQFRQDSMSLTIQFKLQLSFSFFMQQGSVPWQALIYIQYSSGSYMCGATLIGKRSLITAAHCVEGAVQQVRLYLGAHSRNNLPAPIVLSGSSQIIVHENYNSRTLANDIAVLRLPSDVTFNNDIAPACLPGT